VSKLAALRNSGMASGAFGDPGIFSFLKGLGGGIKKVFTGGGTGKSIMRPGPLSITLGGAEGALKRLCARFPKTCTAGGILLGGGVGGAVAAGVEKIFKEKKGARTAEEGAPHRRHGKGITGAQLRGFKRVTNLLRSVGMHPRGLGHTRGASRRFRRCR
jgi:hypothetical protein